MKLEALGRCGHLNAAANDDPRCGEPHTREPLVLSQIPPAATSTRRNHTPPYLASRPAHRRASTSWRSPVRTSCTDSGGRRGRIQLSWLLIVGSKTTFCMPTSMRWHHPLEAATSSRHRKFGPSVIHAWRCPVLAAIVQGPPPTPGVDGDRLQSRRVQGTQPAGGVAAAARVGATRS